MNGAPDGRRGPAGWWAWLVVRARWVVIAVWIAGAVASMLYLPSIESSGTDALGALIPKDAEAVKVEVRSKTQFGFPLLSRTLLVERNAHGLSYAEQRAAFERAVGLAKAQLPGLERVRAALPITNTLGRPPFTREHATTVVTYLFIDPAVSRATRLRIGQRLVDSTTRRPGTFVGTTGLAPARIAQADLTLERLPWIELATVLLVALAVGVRLLALGAPLITLAAIGIAYAVASHVSGWVGHQIGFSIPQEVEPVIVVLVFGVVTDYSVFFISRCRSLLGQGASPVEAAERASRDLTPIVTTAGVTVVGATAALLVAHLGFFRVFGPGLAFSVLVAMLVSLTFIPAALAVGGRAVFWPRRPRRDESIRPSPGVEDPQARRPAPRARSRLVSAATARPWVTLVVALVLLGGAASGVKDLRLSNPVLRGLPPGQVERTAYEQASKGFAPGVLSPTVLIVDQRGITARRAALARLQRELGRQRGVALVLGPAQQPLARRRFGITLSKSTSAARYFIVFKSDPLGAVAISRLRAIEARMPALLAKAGLGRAHAGFAGDTALSAETIDKTVADLQRITPVALAVILVVLALFLRAIVTPLYLVALSLAAFAASLGIGTYFFEDILGWQGITYFVPFATAVLLVSLGSDYNVFLIGRIWQEARERPLREAVAVGASRAARSITLAGLVLAGSFALVALVPVRAFYEIAFIMALGLLIDAFLVRTVMVPAMLLIVGERSAWPGRALRRRVPIRSEGLSVTADSRDSHSFTS